MILTSNDRLLVVAGHKICVAFCGYGTNCCSDSDATCVRCCHSSIGGRHAECKGFAECNLHKSYWKLFSEEEAFIILKSDYRRLSYSLCKPSTAPHSYPRNAYSPSSVTPCHCVKKATDTATYALCRWCITLTSLFTEPGQFLSPPYLIVHQRKIYY